jgi:hypothetical protein
MWELVKEHFEKYKGKVDFKYQPTSLFINTGFSITMFGFPISVYCYEKQSKKKSEKVYVVTGCKKTSIDYTDYNEKDFEKLLKQLIKQKYVLYFSSATKLKLEDFTSHYIKDNLNKKLSYFITEDLATSIVGAKLDSTKKNMPKFIYGVSKKGKLKTLYTANKKPCSADKYWIPKSDEK